MLVLFVLEEVEDPILFHQPRDKVKIRFTVLHTVVPRLESSLKPVLEISKPEVLENLADDIGHGHILKDAAVCRTRQKPQPGDYLGPIVCKPRIAATQGKTAHEAVDVSFPSAAVVDVDPDCDPLAHNFLKGD